jgi:hypothetical protein
MLSPKHTIVLAGGTIAVLAAIGWFLGGHAVCAGYMAEFDIWSRSCTGGKLQQDVYFISLREHLSQALEEAAPWALIPLFVPAVLAGRRLLAAVPRR